MNLTSAENKEKWLKDFLQEKYVSKQNYCPESLLLSLRVPNFTLGLISEQHALHTLHAVVLSTCFTIPAGISNGPLYVHYIYLITVTNSIKTWTAEKRESFSIEGREFSLYRWVQTACAAHPVSYVSFIGVKAAGTSSSPHTSIQCRRLRKTEPYLHYLVRLHGHVLT